MIKRYEDLTQEQKKVIGSIVADLHTGYYYTARNGIERLIKDVTNHEKQT